MRFSQALVAYYAIASASALSLPRDVSAVALHAADDVSAFEARAASIFDSNPLEKRKGGGGRGGSSSSSSSSSSGSSSSGGGKFSFGPCQVVRDSGASSQHPERKLTSLQLQAAAVPAVVAAAAADAHHPRRMPAAAHRPDRA